MDPIVLERGCARIVGAPRFDPQCFGRPTARGGGRRREEGLIASRFGERARELRARADRELAVDAREVDLDRPLGNEERLRDLAVGGASSRSEPPKGRPTTSETPKGSRNHPGALLAVAAEKVARRAGV